MKVVRERLVAHNVHLAVIAVALTAAATIACCIMLTVNFKLKELIPETEAATAGHPWDWHRWAPAWGASKWNKAEVGLV